MTALDLLAKGELKVVGRVRGASNAVLYCTVSYEGHEAACVYKPVAGERPLWDFPDGTLAQREVAAFAVSEATGWNLVPPTVLRDGPYGEGMCQLWIGPGAEAEDAGEAGEADDPADDGPEAEAEAADDVDDAAAEPSLTAEAEAPDAVAGDGGPGDMAVTLLTPVLGLVEGDEAAEGWKAIGLAEVGEDETALLVHADDAGLRRLAVLDAVINNGDRKGGHLLHAGDGRLYAIDHGVTFNVDDKLRTLLWGWAGEPLTEEARSVLDRLDGVLAPGAELAGRLAALLTAAEVDALRERVGVLRRTGLHPAPSGEWPSIPWPPV